MSPSTEKNLAWEKIQDRVREGEISEVKALELYEKIYGKKPPPLEAVFLYTNQKGSSKLAKIISELD